MLTYDDSEDVDGGCPLSEPSHAGGDLMNGLNPEVKIVFSEVWWLSHEDHTHTHTDRHQEWYSTGDPMFRNKREDHFGSYLCSLVSVLRLDVGDGEKWVLESSAQLIPSESDIL